MADWAGVITKLRRLQKLGGAESRVAPMLGKVIRHPDVRAVGASLAAAGIWQAGGSAIAGGGQAKRKPPMNFNRRRFT